MCSINSKTNTPRHIGVISTMGYVTEDNKEMLKSEIHLEVHRLHIFLFKQMLSVEYLLTNNRRRMLV